MTEIERLRAQIDALENLRDLARDYVARNRHRKYGVHQWRNIVRQYNGAIKDTKAQLTAIEKAA